MSEFLKCKIKDLEDKEFKPKSKWLLENGESVIINYSHERNGFQTAGGMFRLPSTSDEYYFNNKGEIYHINYQDFNKDSKDFKYDKDSSRNIEKFVSYFNPLTYDNQTLYKCYLTTKNLYYNDETWNTSTLYCTEDYFNKLGKDGIYDVLCSELGFQKNLSLNIDNDQSFPSLGF